MCILHEKSVAEPRKQKHSNERLHKGKKTFYSAVTLHELISHIIYSAPLFAPIVCLFLKMSLQALKLASGLHRVTQPTKETHSQRALAVLFK